MCSLATSGMTAAQRLRELRLLIESEQSSAAYPRVLQSLLASRYPAQSIVVSNEGKSGETVGEGKLRLPGVLTADVPQVLLLQEGANDINQAHPPVDTIVANLRVMIRGARGRGITVIIGTLLPERQNACRGYDYCDGVNDALAVSMRIRALAAEEGAFVVDLYAVFDGQTATLLGLDGLHPNEAGYAKMAETFYNAVREHLEVPSP